LVNKQCRLPTFADTGLDLLGDQEALRRKHDDLVQLYKEKSRRLLQVQELYDKVKQKVQMGNIQRAASDAVDSTLFSGTDAAEAAASTFDRNKRVPTTSLESGQRPDFSEMNKGLPRSRLNQQGDTNQWAHFSLSRSGNDLGATFGDDARQRLGSQALGGVPEYPNSNSATMLNPRSFASNVQGFAPGRHRLSGLGLTSGLKVSQPTRVPSLEVVWDNGIEDPSAPRH
jgi:E3 ubiquitin-protein ligase CCNP1IP1